MASVTLSEDLLRIQELMWLVHWVGGKYWAIHAVRSRTQPLQQIGIMVQHSKGYSAVSPESPQGNRLSNASCLWAGFSSLSHVPIPLPRSPCK